MAAHSTAAREGAGCDVERSGRSVQVAELVGRGEGSARAPYSWHLMQRAREGIDHRLDHRPERFPRIARLCTNSPQWQQPRLSGPPRKAWAASPGARPHAPVRPMAGQRPGQGGAAGYRPPQGRLRCRGPQRSLQVAPPRRAVVSQLRRLAGVPLPGCIAAPAAHRRRGAVRGAAHCPLPTVQPLPFPPIHSARRT